MSVIDLFEIGSLDDAIFNCQELTKCLESSIDYVHQLNIKYNSCAWLDSDYDDYLNSLLHTLKADDVQTPTKARPFHGSSSRLGKCSPYTPSPRRNHSLIGASLSASPLIGSPTVKLHRNVRDIILSSSDINLRFLKIKRNIESLLYNVEHTIQSSNKRSIYLAKLRCRVKDSPYARRRRYCNCH